MQWAVMFEDLLAQLEQQERAEIHAMASDLLRADLAMITMVERLREQGNSPIGVALAGGTELSGTVLTVLPAWILVKSDNREVLIPTSAVITVGNLSARTGSPSTLVESRLTLGHALRRIAATRLPVALSLRTGARIEGSIDRVGSDHLDVVAHPIDRSAPTARESASARRRRAVTVSFDGLAAVTQATPVGA